MVLAGRGTLQVSGTVGRSSQVGHTHTVILGHQSATFTQNSLSEAVVANSLPGNYNGKWETTNCFKSLGYICEMTGGQNPKPTAAPGQ